MMSSCIFKSQERTSMAWKSSKQRKLQVKPPWPSALKFLSASEISSAAATFPSLTTSEPQNRDTVALWSISGQCSGTKDLSTKEAMRAGTPHKMKASLRRRRSVMLWTHQGRRSKCHSRVDTRYLANFEMI